MRRFGLVWVLVVFFFSSLRAEDFYTPEDYKKIFLKEIEARLGKVYPNLSLERFSVEPRNVKVEKNIPYKANFLGRAGLGSNTLVLVFFKEGKEALRIRVWGYVEAYVPVLVLTKPLEKGEVIREEHVVFEKKPLSKLPQDVILQKEEVLGKELRTSLKPNVVLRKSFLAEALLIKRGQVVVITARGKGFLVQAKGKALQDGRKEEMIKVKNLSSNKEVLGKVVSSKEIEVVL
ncbi:flagellar basal body P-ring formation protein FlgA [Thermodesulfobacterium sp. TA1]|uniref:flagellar basal body P-ring formation chaperone FlgA n=1 Tax=Thermodesulfobacterium sp. TA1 TaxID=2234087 RepID=UPI00123212EF|nr:flagellar basal body P-ring formation chaperone FlgA [Thermodesulfobacterium sp. TA1]QER42381.1 flagellar basal body P-ring formation protein FlgA [Thermodesulfobacterium sp. TA1]